MYSIAKQSFINIRSENTDLQNAKNVRRFEFRGYGLRISLKGKKGRKINHAKLPKCTM